MRDLGSWGDQRARGGLVVYADGAIVLHYGGSIISEGNSCAVREDNVIFGSDDVIFWCHAMPITIFRNILQQF